MDLSIEPADFAGSPWLLGVNLFWVRVTEASWKLENGDTVFGAYVAAHPGPAAYVPSATDKYDPWATDADKSPRRANQTRRWGTCRKLIKWRKLIAELSHRS